MADRDQHPTAKANAHDPPPAARVLVLEHCTLSTRVGGSAIADEYDATQVASGAPCRVHLLRQDATRGASLVHRAVCEADAAHWLRHPASAKLVGTGYAPGDRLYVAVELPAGHSLREVLKTEGCLPAARVVRLASQLVDALDEAHALGLVHGRLTPDAITLPDAADLVAVRPVALSGLGLGWLVRPSELRDDERPYVSPEQLAGADPDVRSDVYGLASLLLATLAGEPPVASGVGTAGLPASVADVIAVARSKDPAHRPAGIKTFWEELLAALVSVPAAAEPAPGPAAVAAKGTPVPTTARPTPVKPRRAARTTGSMAIVNPLDGPDPARRRDLGAIDLAFELVPVPAPPLQMRVERTPDGFGYGETADGGSFGSTSGSSFWFGGFDVWTPGGGAAPVRFGGTDAAGTGGFRRPPIADQPRPGKLAPRAVIQSRLAPMPPMAGYAPPPRSPFAPLAHAWLLGIPAVAAALAWLLSNGGIGH